MPEISSASALGGRAGSGAFEGDLQSLGIPALLEFLELERRTGVLVVESPQGRALMELRDGQARYSAFGDLRGEDALRAFIQLRNGYFRFEFQPELAQRGAADGRGYSIQAIRLEEAIREDESGRIPTAATSGGLATDPRSREHVAGSLASEKTVLEEPQTPGSSVERRRVEARPSSPRGWMLAVAGASLIGITVLATLVMRLPKSEVSGVESSTPSSATRFVDSRPSKPGLAGRSSPTASHGPREAGSQPSTKGESPLSLPNDAEIELNPAGEPEPSVRAAGPDGAFSLTPRTSVDPAGPEQASASGLPLDAGASPAPNARVSSAQGLMEPPRALAARSKVVDDSARDEQPKTRIAGRAESPAIDPPAVVAQRPRLQLPAVWVGELVTPGPGVVSPRLESPLAFNLSRDGRRLLRAYNAELQLLVDHLGRVHDSKLVAPPELSPRDARRLHSAGRAAKFIPAAKDGIAVQMWSTVRLGAN